MNKWYTLSAAAAITAAAIFLVSVSQAEQVVEPQAELNLESVENRASYAIGVSIGRDIKQQDLGLNAEVILRGLHDALKEDEEIRMSDEELQQALMALQEQAMERQMREFQALAERNLERGKQFLEANKDKPGVQTTESGLQYKVIEEGSGSIPGPADQVMAHYRGTLIDGEEFDSSYARDEPLTLPVQGVIPGWSEALQMMPVGSKWELYIPADLAYGEQGVGNGVIGPNETLVFEIELLSIIGQE